MAWKRPNWMCVTLCSFKIFFISCPRSHWRVEGEEIPFSHQKFGFRDRYLFRESTFPSVVNPGRKRESPETGKTAAGKFSETDSLWSFVAIIGQVTCHECFFVAGFHCCPARHNDYRINDRVDCSFFVIALLFHSNFYGCAEHLRKLLRSERVKIRDAGPIRIRSASRAAATNWQVRFHLLYISLFRATNVVSLMR